MMLIDKSKAKKALVKTKRDHLISFGVQFLRCRSGLKKNLKSEPGYYRKGKRVAIDWGRVLEKANKRVNNLHPFFRTVNVNLKVNSYRSLVYLSKSKEDKVLNCFSHQQKHERGLISYKRFLLISKADYFFKQVQEKNNLLITQGLKKDPIHWFDIFHKSNHMVEVQYPYLKEFVVNSRKLDSLISQLYSYRKKCVNVNNNKAKMGDKNHNKSYKKEMHKKHLLIFQKALRIYIAHLDKQTFLVERGFTFMQVDWDDLFCCAVKCVNKENPLLIKISVVLTSSILKQQVLYLFGLRNVNSKGKIRNINTNNRGI